MSATHACFVDCDHPQNDPDPTCVLDAGRPNDCTYGRCGDKTICPWWMTLQDPPITLQSYLAKEFARGAIDHSIRAHVTSDGEVTFYIHPTSKDGDTEDFRVNDNQLTPTTNRGVPHAGL